MTNRWSSLLLTVVLLLGIGLCLKSFDFLLVNEVKALISILFGFVTSALILCFVWLIQKKPISPSLSLDDNHDEPVMHPRGRSASETSLEHQRGFNICAISPLFDDPPDYEDALINSKPVSWSAYQINQEKYANEILQNYSTESTSGHLLNDCGYKFAALCDRSKNNQFCPRHSVADSDSLNNSNNFASDFSEVTANNDMAQLALSIVRGFTTLEPMNHPQINRSRYSHDYGNMDRGNTYHNRSRKLSYCQLDVSQLIVTESPPRYCDLQQGRRSVPELYYNSNEPTAGPRHCPT